MDICYPKIIIDYSQNNLLTQLFIPIFILIRNVHKTLAA